MEKLYSCRTCLLGLYFVLCVIKISDADSSPVTYDGQSMVVDGNPFEIVCRLSVFHPLKWQLNGVTLYPNETTKVSIMEDKFSQNVVVSKLTITQAHDSHSGEYKCSPLVGLGHSLVVVRANSISGNYDFDKFKVMEHRITFVLQCNFTLDSASAGNVVLEWQKNRTTLDTSDRLEIKSAENKLIILRPTEADAGNYSCILRNKKTNATDQLDFNVVFKPLVKLPPNHSVVEGEKLTLTCNVIGDPVPEVYWRIGNKTYEKSEGRVKLLPKDNISNVVLQIDEAVMDDRNTYTCAARNVANRYSNATEASCYVRVKDKLAALWPFLGICAEVIVLCAIILIYEKKRNKTELDESDTDGSPEQKNTPDHGKDSEVRHRK